MAGVLGTVLTLWPSSEPTKADTPASPLSNQPASQALVQDNGYNSVEHPAESHNTPESRSTNSNVKEMVEPDTYASALPHTSASQPQSYARNPLQGPLSNGTTNDAQVIKLTGQEYDELANAMLEAYPDKEDFARMLKAGLNKQLNALVDGAHNYSNLLFKLIELTEAEGWTSDLVMAAHKRRPGNLALQSWQQRYEAQHASTRENMTPPILQQTDHASPGIIASSELVRTSVPYQEQQSKQKVGSSPDLEAQKNQELPQALPNSQSSLQSQMAIKEARNGIYKFKAIFEGKGDIQQIHYRYVTAALREVSTCVQNLQQSLPIVFPHLANADRERLFMNLRRIDTQVDDAIAHIVNYDTFNPHQRERNRKDTETRLSSLIDDLDEISGYLMSSGPL